MVLDGQTRAAILAERADGYLHAALGCITRGYPHMPYFVATGPDSYRTHRALHPAFFGSFDWHSCVAMHWAIVRLLRLFPDLPAAADARITLDELLTPDHLAAEVAFFADPHHRTLERPYGWGWLLTLHHELATWDDPDGQRWAAAVAPLADVLATNLVVWLPRLTYPQRTGLHPNTAFGLSRSLDHARWRADRGDEALVTAIHAAARGWFAADTDYPAHYEPSGADFLSPALTEAELMARLLPPTAFPAWLDRFLPGIVKENPTALVHPAVVSDATDGQIAHLHGLNLSRAWCFIQLAGSLPDDDPRGPALLAAAKRHADAALPHVVGGDYMTEHWLAAYATLLLT